MQIVLEHYEPNIFLIRKKTHWCEKVHSFIYSFSQLILISLTNPHQTPMTTQPSGFTPISIFSEEVLILRWYNKGVPTQTSFSLIRVHAQCLQLLHPSFSLDKSAQAIFWNNLKFVEDMSKIKVLIRCIKKIKLMIDLIFSLSL